MENTISIQKKINWTSAAVELICYAYVLLFIYAGIYKLLDYTFFVITLSRSPLIGPFAAVLAWLVPVGEIVVSLLLLIKRTRLFGLYLAFGIMAGFTAYISYLFTFAPEVPCSCGGILGTMGWAEHLLLNSVYTAMGATGIVLERRKRNGRR